MIIQILKKYTAALLGALASIFAVLYFRKDALFQKKQREQAEQAVKANEEALENVQEQSQVAAEQQKQKQKERRDAVSRDSFLDYFE